ncbi:MAG: sensor histidine kinase [Microscillaceae bacterium]|nr:sensor histidine kinase [Microscillaceae bacterium]
MINRYFKQFLVHKFTKLLLVLIFWQLELVAQVPNDLFVIHTPQLDTAIHTKTKILLDTGGRFSFDQIRNPQFASRFRTNKRDNFGFNAPVIWLKIAVQNQTDERFFMVLDLKTIDKVSFYEVLPSGEYSVVHTGSVYPFTSRAIQTNGFIFELKIPKNQVRTYYFRLDSRRSLRLPLRLLSADSLLKNRHQVDFFQGVYVGALLFILIFSLFLFLSTRERAFFWYIFYIIAFALVITNQTGYAEGFLWANYPQVNQYVGALVAISNTLHWAFLFTYLQTARRVPWLHFASYFFILLPFLGCLVASLLGYVGESILWINNFTFLAIVYSTFTLWQVKRKHKVSNFFTVAILFLWTFIIIHTIYLLGGLPVNLITSNSIVIGGLGEAIFLAFALTDQINLVREEKEEIQAENLRLTQEQNQILEVKIQERTTELQNLNQELASKSESLSQLNQTKDKLFSVISHDFRSPLNSMKGVLRLLKEGHLTEAELKFLAGSLEEKVNVTAILLDNLLFWAKSQMDGLIIQMEDFDLKPLIDEQFDLFKFQAQDKKIQLTHDLDTELKVFADPNCIRLIIRNILSNAIKFCQAGDKISLGVKVENNYAIVAIADTGVGIAADKLPFLFEQASTTIGTAQEKGTGLGLMLCKDFIQKNRGEIWVESQENEGSTFYFSLLLGRN